MVPLLSAGRALAAPFDCFSAARRRSRGVFVAFLQRPPVRLIAQSPLIYEVHGDAASGGFARDTALRYATDN
ncbi:unnamed protein product, partial [Iphiclides podalirius]